MQMRTNPMLALAAALALPMAACDDETTFQPGAQGQVSVFLTDAPGDFEAAVVTITRVELVAAGAEDSASGQAGGVVVLRDEAWTGDLLELQNEVAALVQGENVPEGRYTQLRLVIPEGCIEVETETGSAVYSSSDDFTACGTAEGDLQMPSFGQSGLKINLPGGGVDVSGSESLLLDFDVSESFGRQAGQSGRWVLSPTIRATRFDAAATVNVSLTLGSGVTLPAGVVLDELAIRMDGEDPVAVGSDGAVTFSFVTAGEHTLTLVGPEGFTLTTVPATPHTVTTTAGASTDVALELTGVI